MTPRERVYRALRFEETDIVPHQVNFIADSRRRLAEYYGDADFESKIGNHLATMSHRQSDLVEVQPGYVKDRFGVVWNRTVDKDIGVIENQLFPEPTIGGYIFPDPLTSSVFDNYPEFIEKNTDKFRTASIGFSLYERAWSMRGMENLLLDMVENPSFVHELLDAILDYNLKHIGKTLTFDIDCVFIGDDWGSQTGLIMGPSLWREFIKPRVAQMYKLVRDSGKFVMIHSCGDVKMLLPDLVEVGLQVFNPFQPETMDVFETKKRYYGQLAFYGGISVQHLLPHGTPDEVRTEVGRLLKELGKGGGYIAAPSHVVPADIPPENVAAMIEVFGNQLKFP